MSQSWPYSPGNWYWNVANRTGTLTYYNSRRALYVDNTDSDYVSFIDSGNSPTPIDFEGSLADVLTKGGLTGFPVLNTNPPATGWGLVTPADIVAAAIAAGCKVTGDATIVGTYPLGGAPWQSFQNTMIYVNAFTALPAGVPLQWLVYDGTVTFTTAPQFSKTFRGLNDYVAKIQEWALHGSAAPPWGTFNIP